MKQKHWQVSVFDKTSDTIIDDTLYTTDTEVYLVFELIDEDFKPDTATVTIYNIYGTATINESVDIVDGIVNYEIPIYAIGHQGGWRTQVVFTKDNEDYTTTVIEFDVDGHLLDNNKPTIVYIENWNRFIKHGEGLIDDWEQLEKIRQTNERKRESAESVRQNIFETNETSRQTNELDREENEQTRESAESVRVANETERISKDSERDSKLEAVEERLGVIEEDVVVNATNLMVNGDFSKTPLNNYWNVLGFASNLRTNEYGIATIETDSRGWNAITTKQPIGFFKEHKYYMKTSVYTENTNNDYSTSNFIEGIGGVRYSYRNINNEVFNVISTVITAVETVDESPIFRVGRSTGIVKWKLPILIDLTKTFGVGNEPTAEQMDKLLEQFPNGWFDGTENLFKAKTALESMLKLDSKKANKQQENWIEPTMLNGWTGSTRPYATLSFMKDDFGFVHLRGQVTGGVDGQIFVLPPGYRPNGLSLFTINTVFGEATIVNRVAISGNGNVSVDNYGDNRSRPLNGIYFKAGE